LIVFGFSDILKISISERILDMENTFRVQVAKRGLITLPKELRDANRIQDGDVLTLFDLGGAFVLTTQTLQVDKIADRLAKQWRDEGETLESMLQMLHEVREEYDSKA
jgi:bifunctional DNA-binding transcriptional regulator/antitoxin component of YhaV-PrlF toxin-antitoxin module